MTTVGQSFLEGVSYGSLASEFHINNFRIPPKSKVYGETAVARSMATMKRRDMSFSTCLLIRCQCICNSLLVVVVVVFYQRFFKHTKKKQLLKTHPLAVSALTPFEM